MLSNKIIADRPLAGNENRAHIHKSGRYQEMTPRSADGPIADGRIDPTNSVHGNEMGPGILGAPINPDPHRHGRRSNNISEKPPERSGSHYNNEIHRRLRPGTLGYK